MPPAERIGVESYFGISDFTRNTGVYDKTLQQMDKRTRAYGKSVSRSTVGAERSWEDYARRLTVVVRQQQGDINGLKRAVSNYAASNRRSTQEASSDWQKFSKSLIGQTMKMRATFDALKFSFAAFTGPFRQFIALGMEAVGIQRTQRMFTRMVGGADKYTEALEEMRKATRGTIKDTELISSAFRIMNMGLAATAEQAARVARNVTLLGKAAGQVPTPQAAMQVFALMMSNQSRMRLDAFNLTIGETDTRIAHLKKTMGVSEEEAFRLAIFELMDEKVQQMGLDVEDATTQVNRMNAQFQNFVDNLKTIVVPEFNDFVNILESVASSFNANKEDIELWYRVTVGAIRGVVAWWGDYVKVVALGVVTIADAIMGNLDKAKTHYDMMWETIRDIVTGEAILETMRKEIAKVGEAAEDSAQGQMEALESAAAEAAGNVADIIAAWDKKKAEAAEMAEKKIAATRVRETYIALDAIIAAQRRREDVARQTAKAIQQIETQLSASISQAKVAYEKVVENAAHQHAKARLSIEENYQKAIAAINRKFDMMEDDAIRSRDALALAKARRGRKDELDQARVSRDEQTNKADEQYNDQIVAAKKSLEEQEKAARESYDNAMAQLEKSLKEQEAEKAISDTRKAEDAKTARARELGRVKIFHGKLLSDDALLYGEQLTAANAHYTEMLTAAKTYRDMYNITVRGGTPTAPAPPGSFGYSMAEGGAFVATQPTTVVVGDAGPEFFMAQPVRNMPAAPQTMNVNHLVTGQVQAQVQAVIQQSIAGLEGQIGSAINRALSDVFRGMR